MAVDDADDDDDDDMVHNGHDRAADGTCVDVNKMTERRDGRSRLRFKKVEMFRSNEKVSFSENLKDESRFRFIRLFACPHARTHVHNASAGARVKSDDTQIMSVDCYRISTLRH